MADFEHPRSKRPDDADAGDDVYGLADDDPSSSDENDSQVDDLLSEPASPAAGQGQPPKAAAPQAAPLPRIWKVTPEPQKPRTPERKDAKTADSDNAARSKSNAAKPRDGGNGIERVGQVRKLSEKKESSSRSAPRERKGKGNGPSEEPGVKKVLVEETPKFDTYESRQRVRALIGVTMLGAAVVGGFILVRTYFPSVPSADDPSNSDIPIPHATAPAAVNPQALEAEASSLFERARDAAQKKEDAKLAISLLERVVSTYPNTNAAREAKEALARPAKNLPLFVDRPVVVADTVPVQKATEASPTPVVNATAPTAPTASAAEVALLHPANPAEPSPVGTAPPETAPHVGRPLPKGFRSKPGTRAHESGWALEIVGDRDGATMVLVPGGEFVMGNDDGDVNERPTHRVKMSTYYIDQHEVTNRQFALFEKESGRRTDRARALAREETTAPASEDGPVVMVSAKEARDFAAWAGKRLPTEAQWELAARGYEGNLYPWGPTPPQAGAKREVKRVGPVMADPNDVSPFGAHDMAGNAWEWTKDWYDSRYFVLVKNQTSSDPTGPSIVPRTLQLAVKGGSKTWTVTKREGLKYEQRLPFLGFRCVLAVEGPGNAFESPKSAGPTGGGQPAAGTGAEGPPAF